MIQYYVVKGNNDAATAIKVHQGIDGVEWLNSKEDLWKAPSMQDFQGKAVIVCSDRKLSKRVDFESVGSTAIVYTEDKNVVVFDCSHPFVKSKIGSPKNPAKFMGFNIGKPSYYSISDELDTLFSATTVPAPEPVVEPEPSDFEVETWVPQDEYPSSGE